MSGGRGVRGNREVSPLFLLSVRGGGRHAASAEATSKEGGSWGKHGFPHGSEPKASDAHARTAVSPISVRTPLRAAITAARSFGTIPPTNVPSPTSRSASATAMLVRPSPSWSAPDELDRDPEPFHLLGDLRSGAVNDAHVMTCLGELQNRAGRLVCDAATALDDDEAHERYSALMRT